MEWIDVKDALPNCGETVIVCRKSSGGEKVEQGVRELGSWWRVYGTRVKNVTHWMPLPPPPEK